MGNEMKRLGRPVVVELLCINGHKVVLRYQHTDNPGVCSSLKSVLFGCETTNQTGRKVAQSTKK